MRPAPWPSATGCPTVPASTQRMQIACSFGRMSRMLQVRNVPDDVHAELRRRAQAAGVSLSEYLLRELERIAARPPIEEVLARSASRRLDISMADVVETIRAERPGR